MNFTGGSTPKKKRKPAIKHTPKLRASAAYKKKAARLQELIAIRNRQGLSQAGLHELETLEAYIEAVAVTLGETPPGKVTPKPIKNPIKAFVNRVVGLPDTEIITAKHHDSSPILDSEEPQPGLEGEEE